MYLVHERIIIKMGEASTPSGCCNPTEFDHLPSCFPAKMRRCTKGEAKRQLLLDVVIRQSATVFKLLSGENEALLLVGMSSRQSGS